MPENDSGAKQNKEEKVIGPLVLGCYKEEKSVIIIIWVWTDLLKVVTMFIMKIRTTVEKTSEKSHALSWSMSFTLKITRFLNSLAKKTHEEGQKE